MEIVNDINQLSPIWIIIGLLAVYYITYHTPIVEIIVNTIKGIIDSL
jgi:hypothetical protein